MDATRNSLVVGPAAALDRREFTVRETTFSAGVAPTDPFEALVKVRSKAAPVRGEVTPLPDGRAAVMLSEPVQAITPSQAAVFYAGAEGTVVLGGGLIE